MISVSPPSNPSLRFLSFTHAVVGWCCILVLAIANGGLREAVLIPQIGSALGTAISGLLLMLAVCLVAFFLLRLRPPRKVSHTIWLGAAWLFATLAFEFIFGALVQRKSMRELLAAYTFQGGNLWPCVLLAVLVAPYVVARFSRIYKA
jgi:hypothetical protein